MKPFDARDAYDTSMRPLATQLWKEADKHNIACVVMVCDMVDAERYQLNSSVNLPGPDRTPDILFAVHELLQRGPAFAADVLAMAHLQDILAEEDKPIQEDGNVH